MKFLRYIAPILLFGCFLLGTAGCNSSPRPIARTQNASVPATGSGQSQQDAVHRRGNALENDQPGHFDFYLLNLSWSPEFCTTHPGSPECAARPGFIVHGLWPQNNDGSYPDKCVGMPTPPNPSAYLDLMPTINLIDHEWQTHGTCSGLNPEAYFGAVRSALRSIEIPGTFAASQEPPPSITPNALLAQFSRANPTFPPSSFALSCGNNYLTAIEVCFDKGLHPQSCQGVHSCGARTIKIAPR